MRLYEDNDRPAPMMIEIELEAFEYLIQLKAERNILMNAVNTEVPYEMIRKCFSGQNDELEAYRKTNITPEQICELDHMYADLCREKAKLSNERDRLRNELRKLTEVLLSGECDRLEKELKKATEEGDGGTATHTGDKKNDD